MNKKDLLSHIVMLVLIIGVVIYSSNMKVPFLALVMLGSINLSYHIGKYLGKRELEKRLSERNQNTGTTMTFSAQTGNAEMVIRNEIDRVHRMLQEASDRATRSNISASAAVSGNISESTRGTRGTIPGQGDTQRQVSESDESVPENNKSGGEQKKEVSNNSIRNLRRNR